MNQDSPYPTSSSIGNKEYLSRKLSIGAVLIIVLTVLITGFHHHRDLQDHPECTICAAVYHAPALTSAPLVLAVLWIVLPGLVLPPIAGIPVQRPTLLPPCRASPVSV
jgi:hypothetical protein